MSEKKSPFGSYAIIDAVRHYFKDEPEYWWDINPPTTADELALTRYMNTGKATIRPDGGMETEGAPSWLDILLYEIALLFGGTNIPADPESPVEDGGEPVISTKAKTETIQRKLGEFPMEMIAEIGDAMADAVPGWGPKNPLSRAKREEE